MPEEDACLSRESCLQCHPPEEAISARWWTIFLWPSRDILIAAIDHMDRNFDVRKEGVSIRNALALLVKEIRLTPIEGERFGETVEIRLKPEGWPDF